ncbi:MAG: hypothetical protein JSS96_09480 [Bacteroidetes bacterium]|nr:hypothetical protein [Bacteroidota bacterium]
MKKAVFILLFLCVAKSTAYCKDYLTYHAYINAAERHLVNKEFDSCFYYYDKAFNEFDFVFVKDPLIAAEAALKANDGNRIVNYLIKGAQNGLRTDCLNIDVFDALKSLPVYATVHNDMDTAYESYTQKHRANEALAADWLQRYDLLLDAQQIGTSSELETRITDDVKYVKDILKKSGFPAEKMLGIMNCEDMANYSAIAVLLTYDCWMAENHEALWEAVKRGELLPKEFAAMCEAELNNEKTKNFHRVYNAACYIKLKPWGMNFGIYSYIPESRYAEVNALRAQYAICDIETDLKKKQLERTGEYKFNFGKWRPPIDYH